MEPESCDAPALLEVEAQGFGALVSGPVGSRPAMNEEETFGDAPALRLLDRQQGQTSVHDEHSARAASTETSRRWLCCRACAARIANTAARMDSGPLVFVNPGGRVYEVIQLRHARGLRVVGPATTDDTWFTGYAWSVALCAGCLNHLGWRYSAALAGTEPGHFFGLVRTELVERDEGEGANR